MTTKTLIATIFAVGFGALCLGRPYAWSAPAAGRFAKTTDICTGSPIPSGWIKVNDRWSPTSCGNPSSITYNVTTIAQYTDVAVNGTLDVCTGAPTPPNWVVAGNRWSPTSCGHPTNITQNVTTIRRLQ